jgi:DDE_Tnp_1-associated
MCLSDINRLSEIWQMDATSAIGQMFSPFAVVQDPRRQYPMTRHSLEAILIITIFGTIWGAQNWVEIEQWGEARKAWLSEFLELPYGIPSPDTFGRVFALLDPAGLHQSLVADSALDSADHLQHLATAGMKWLSRVPATLREAQEALARAVPETMVPLREG